LQLQSSNLIPNWVFVNLVSTEPWTVKACLNLAWMGGYRKVDWKVVQRTILQDQSRYYPNFTLLAQIKELLDRNWNVIARHACREGNIRADWLASIEGSAEWGAIPCSPPELMDLLREDYRRSASVRMWSGLVFFYLCFLGPFLYQRKQRGRERDEFRKSSSRATPTSVFVSKADWHMHTFSWNPPDTLNKYPSLLPLHHPQNNQTGANFRILKNNGSIFLSHKSWCKWYQLFGLSYEKLGNYNIAFREVHVQYNMIIPHYSFEKKNHQTLMHAVPFTCLINLICSNKKKMESKLYAVHGRRFCIFDIQETSMCRISPQYHVKKTSLFLGGE